MLKAPAREKKLALLKYVEFLLAVLLRLVPFGIPGIQEFNLQLPEVYYPDKFPSYIVSALCPHWMDIRKTHQTSSIEA